MAYKPKYQELAEQYALKHNMHLVYHIATEGDTEVFFLHDRMLEGRKTGWPTFVRVGKDKIVVPVSEIPEIHRYISICNNKPA